VSKVDYTWDGKNFLGLFFFAPAFLKMFTTVNIGTLGSKTCMSVCSDKAYIPDPEKIIEAYLRINKEVLSNESNKPAQ